MKKLIGLVSMAALALTCFTGCPNSNNEAPDDNNNTGGGTDSILANAALVGTFDGWDSGYNMADLLVEGTTDTYSLDFVAKAENMFKIQETAGSWDSGWGANNGLTIEAPSEVGETSSSVSLVYSNSSTGDNVNMIGLNAYSTYTLTIKIVDAADKTVSATLTYKEKGKAPETYSWEGMELKGGWVTGWDNVFTLTADKTQEFTTKEANGSQKEWGIFPAGLGNEWFVENLKFGSRTEMTYTTSDRNNSTVAEDWESEAKYTIKLELTDDNFESPKAYVTITKVEE